SVTLPGAVRSRDAEHLHSCRLGVAIEHRVDMLYDVGAHVEKGPLVLYRNEGAFGTVVHRYLKRLYQRAERLDVALNTQVTQYEERGGHWSPAQRGVACNEYRCADFCLDPIVQE